MRTSPTPDADAGGDWIYNETIDEDASAIHVRGRVDRLGVDLLRGTVEELSRRGHRHITVTVRCPDDVDAFARAVLAEVAEHLARCEGRLTVRWSAGADDVGLGPVDHSGDRRTNGHARHRDGEVVRPRPAVR